jgi:hypothetical protein
MPVPEFAAVHRVVCLEEERPGQVSERHGNRAPFASVDVLDELRPCLRAVRLPELSTMDTVEALEEELATDGREVQAPGGADPRRSLIGPVALPEPTIGSPR